MKITVTKKRTGKKDIIILVSAWGTPKFIFNKIKHKIPKNFGYIHYHYTYDILNTDPYLTKRYFLKLMNKMVKDLKLLNKKRKRNFYSYAQSLGGVFAAYLLDKIDIKKSVFILPGDNLADCVLNGKETLKIKNEMEKNKITLKKLKKLLKEISQDTHFKNKAKNVKYYIKLSVNDNVVPYKNGLKLIKIFKKKNFTFELYKGRLLHKAMCLYEALFPEKTIEFLTRN